MQKIMCAIMLMLALAGQCFAAEVEQLGQAEEGGFVFRIGNSQVLVKINGDVQAEIMPDALILRPSLPAAETPIGAAAVDRDLQKKRRK